MVRIVPRAVDVDRSAFEHDARAHGDGQNLVGVRSFRHQAADFFVITASWNISPRH